MSATHHQLFSYISDNSLPTPVTFYDARGILESLQVMRQSLGAEAQIYFALKSCYNAPVLSLLSEHQLGVEVMSELEYDIALRHGFRMIVLNGMGRSEQLLRRAATDGAVIIVDSLQDIYTLTDLAKTGMRLKLGIRLRISLPEIATENSYVASDHPLGNDFGTEFADAFFVLCTEANIAWEMLHMHITINETSSQIYTEAMQQAHEMLTEIEQEYHLRPAVVNLGGGFEVYSPQAASDFVEMFRGIRTTHTQLFGGTTLAVEPGRYLSAHAGSTVGKVLDIKQLGQKYWIITDIGTNTLIPIPNARYQLAYPEDSHSGSFCAGVTDGITSPSNNVIHEVRLHELPQVGSYICVKNTGAYTDVYSTFWAYEPHIVCWVDSAGEISQYRTEGDIARLKSITLKDVTESEGEA